jgi:hypothetical protein
MQQLKLESFFKIVTNHNKTNKTCFIYDPQQQRAFFTTKPFDTDVFVFVKCKVKLYYRRPILIYPIVFPIMERKYESPMLKSNLQKAVRRKEIGVAISTSLAMLQQYPLDFLRRLVIIGIEDVCLMNSYSIPVWLMMAANDYTINCADIHILLQIVGSMCQCDCVFDIDSQDLTNELAFTHEELQNQTEFNALLSLYYRSEYGGMKGDMQLLKTAIDYYSKNPSEIQTTIFPVEYSVEDTNISILPETIDFHPFPFMLTVISKITKLETDEIRQLIWTTESCVNKRKHCTIEKSECFKEKKEWKKIKGCLEDLRTEILEKY